MGHLIPKNKEEAQVIYDSLVSHYMELCEMAKTNHIGADQMRHNADVLVEIIKRVRDNLGWDIIH